MIADLDERFQEAVQFFWETRNSQQQKQIDAGKVDAGLRGAVTGGTQMGALEALFADLLVDAGVERTDIYFRRALELPGYYRPEKQWDLLVVSNGVLVIALEFKSQVGPSFGNNYNNRTEEALGNADDLWTAFREGRLGTQQAPLLGFFILVEDCPAVHKPIRPSEPHFKIDPVFGQASYAIRYRVLCERLVLERKYNTTCVTLASNGDPTAISFPSESVSFRRFANAVSAHGSLFADPSRLAQ